MSCVLIHIIPNIIEEVVRVIGEDGCFIQVCYCTWFCVCSMTSISILHDGMCFGEVVKGGWIWPDFVIRYLLR